MYGKVSCANSNVISKSDHEMKYLSGVIPRDSWKWKPVVVLREYWKREPRQVFKL